MRIETIDRRRWNGPHNGSVDYEETLVMVDMGHRDKLRVRVHGEHYEAQSYARIERWDGTRWNELHTVPGQLIQTTRYAYSRDTAGADAAIENDRQALLRVAEGVLE